MSDATPFQLAVNRLWPGATGSDLVALLDGKANRTTALDWKAGRRHAPRWALHMLAQKARAQAAPLLAVADHLESAPDRPGKQFGKINLARWRARS